MNSKINKKTILIFIFSLIVFLILAIPFRDLLKINYAMEVRPAAVLNPVLGMFFGLPAIIATTLGNMILDIQSSVPYIQAIAYFAPEFLYGFIPYYVWHRMNKEEHNPTKIDRMPKIMRFIIATLLGCFVFSTITGVMIGAFNRSASLLIDFMIFTFVNNAVMNLFLGFPLIIALDKFVNKNNITFCEKYLLISAVFESVSIATIIGVTCRLNVGIDIANSHFWEKIYFMCIVAILFIIGISIVIIALQLDKELKEQNYDLDVASAIQKSVLPTNFDLNDDRFNIFASIRPAKSVGGDFYDFYYIDKDHLAFLIADVSGKGIPAALFMMRAVSTIRNYSKLGLEVDEIIHDSNLSLCENNPQCYFVTAWMGIIDLETGTVSYCNAGHNPPAIKTNEGIAELINIEKSAFLGVVPEIEYKKYELSLKKDDVIYLYTDGVTEARNISNEMFTENRLIESLNKSKNEPKEICENMINAIDEFSIKAGQFDDITMLAIKYKMRVNE